VFRALEPHAGLYRALGSRDSLRKTGLCVRERKRTTPLSVLLVPAGIPCESIVPDSVACLLLLAGSPQRRTMTTSVTSTNNNTFIYICTYTSHHEFIPSNSYPPPEFSLPEFTYHQTCSIYAPIRVPLPLQPTSQPITQRNSFYAAPSGANSPAAATACHPAARPTRAFRCVACIDVQYIGTLMFSCKYHSILILLFLVVIAAVVIVYLFWAFITNFITSMCNLTTV